MRGGGAVRIAVTLDGENVSASVGACKAIRLYEDDHGRIVRRTPAAWKDGDTALAVLERCGADVVVCGAPKEDERRALAQSGLLLAPGYSGEADEAVRAWLGRTIACDPGNTCNYCGWKEQCDARHP